MEAAKRICEALRAAGVEVWFDQDELRGGEHSPQPVRVGWSDANYFTRRFRSEFGVTPTDYRARHARLADAAGTGNAKLHYPAA